MEPLRRHQCLVYEGAPSLHLPAVARVVHGKLKDNYRCLYLNTRAMVAGMQSYRQPPVSTSPTKPEKAASS